MTEDSHLCFSRSNLQSLFLQLHSRKSVASSLSSLPHSQRITKIFSHNLPSPTHAIVSAFNTSIHSLEIYQIRRPRKHVSQVMVFLCSKSNPSVLSLVLQQNISCSFHSPNYISCGFHIHLVLSISCTWSVPNSSRHLLLTTGHTCQKTR